MNTASTAESGYPHQQKENHPIDEADGILQ